MDDRTLPHGGSPLVDEIADWLMSQALGDGDIREVFAGCSRRLVAAGLPVTRAFVSFRTLHPLYATVMLVWRRGEAEVAKSEMLHEQAFTSEQWWQSPMYHMLESRIPYLRRRLTGTAAMIDFPVLEDLQREGATDYLAYLVPFATDEDPGPHEHGVIGSWATDRPGGFTAQELRDLKRVQRRLAVACKMQIRREITTNVLDAYLGPEAGKQVLDGSIRLGDGRRVHAVIWFSDLRRSTEWAEALSDAGYLELLNSYFECTAGAVLAHGGEVLRFIGDAVLAIFPIDAREDGAECAACPALDAASEARRRLAALNADRASRGLEPLHFGLGLHVGDVMFGNIGVRQRVEFSVTGRAANEVARLEALTKPLERDVVVSGDLAALVPLEWESLGEHEVRGVGQPLAVFAPPAGLSPGLVAAAAARD